MISAEEALAIGRQHYPAGPEQLVEQLGVPVRYSPMGGCDGWCITDGDRAVIRLNSSGSPKRKRFTLAHELGHLILGVPAMIGESLAEMLSSDNDDEKRVNAFAAELLIPRDIVASSIKEIPVISTALKRLAKDANVSEVSVALRVANRALELGLVNASVVHFDGSGIKWQWSRTLRMSNDTAHQLLNAASESAPTPFRMEHSDGNIAVASLIENSFFGSATLFTQLLPPELGNSVTSDERRRELEARLLTDPGLKHRMNGIIGALKNRIQGKTAVEVEQDFWERYTESLADTPINSDEGREYVRLRIEQWMPG